MEWINGSYKISTDKSLLSLDKIKEFLSKSYWANKRAEDRIEKSIENSQCYGVYCNNDQVGFARVVSDYATMFWICDVYIDDKYRGKGLGKKLIECIVNRDEYKNCIGVLATRDAHGLYKQFGFKDTDGKAMFKRND